MDHAPKRALDGTNGQPGSVRGRRRPLLYTLVSAFLIGRVATPVGYLALKKQLNHAYSTKKLCLWPRGSCDLFLVWRVVASPRNVADQGEIRERERAVKTFSTAC